MALLAALFSRQASRADLEDRDETQALDDGQLLLELPRFAVFVSDVATDGWHMAALLGESSNPDFYTRALGVRWPFLIARPTPSTRSTDRPTDPEQLSPAGTTPARKLVVNWRWVTAEGSVSQLRFYVRRRARIPFPGRLRIRVTLKQLPWPRRRIVVAVKSNRITWNPPVPEETLASPPEQST
jgi:hypothetical protein